MKLRLISLLLMVALILTVPGVSGAINKSYLPPAAAPQDLASAKTDDNNYLGFPYFVDKLPSGQKLRMENYSGNEHVLIYGNPSGDYKQGQYRYLGVNKKGENIPNVNFPYDATPEGKLEDQKWVIEPWNDKTIIKYLKSKKEKIQENQPFDGDADFLENIKTGLKLKHPTEYRGTPAVQWNKIVHILQPPTYYGWGVGRAWHKKADGSIWYRTIPIAPTKLVPKPAPPAPQPNPPGKDNLKIYITGHSGDSWPGNTVTVNAQAINESGKYLTTDLVWKLNGKIIKTVNNFDLIKTSNSSVSFKMPSGDAKLEVSINPNKTRPANEITWVDNTGGTTIKPLTLPTTSGKDITVSISAPSQVEPNKIWSYTVIVKYNWKRPKGYSGPPPTKFLELSTTVRGKQSQGYNFDTGNISPKIITKNENDSFKISGGSSIPFKYTFPGTSMVNEGYYITINSSLDSGASDAVKVYVKPLLKDEPGVEQYR